MDPGASGILSVRALVAAAFTLLLGAGAPLCPVLCSATRVADSVTASAMPCHSVPSERSSGSPDEKDPSSCTTCATLTVALATLDIGVASPESAPLPQALAAPLVARPVALAAAFSAPWAARPPPRPLFLLVSSLLL